MQVGGRAPRIAAAMQLGGRAWISLVLGQARHAGAPTSAAVLARHCSRLSHSLVKLTRHGWIFLAPRQARHAGSCAPPPSRRWWRARRRVVRRAEDLGAHRLSRFSLHSKRVFSLCSARRTRALLRLKADLLGKHPSKWDSRSSALGARQARTQTSKLHTENNIRFACLASGTKNIPCLASGTKNIPFQKRSRARISSYEAARAQRTLLENFYRGTRLDTCMRLARCAHTCIQNISKSTFFF